MKKIVIVLFALIVSFAAFGQNDTTVNVVTKADTTEVKPLAFECAAFDNDIAIRSADLHLRCRFVHLIILFASLTICNTYSY